MIGAFALSRLRKATENLMPDSLIITRRSFVQDQPGTFSIVGTVPCRAVSQKGGARENVVGGRIDNRVLYEIYVPHGTDIRPATDRVIVVGGGTFTVTGTNDSRSYIPHLRVSCTELR